MAKYINASQGHNILYLISKQSIETHILVELEKI